MSGLPDIGNSMSKSATADLDGGESGIHNPGAGDMDSGLAPLARPGMTAAHYRPASPIPPQSVHHFARRRL
jgi:hypothetical protein